VQSQLVFIQTKFSHYFIFSDPNGALGYICQVDLEYPAELHDLHNEFPLIAEQLTVTQDMLSDYNRAFLLINDIKFTKSKKLCPNFFPKKNYVCALENLQFYLKHGIKLISINSICSFSQTSFMAPFIKLNSELRKQSKSPFKKDFFKLLNNSQYGKLIEDVFKRTKVDVCSTTKKANFLTAQPQFKGFRILDDTHTLVQRVPATVKMDSAIPCGLIVLERSKLLMLQFWYQVLKPRYGDQVNLILSDTDSFIFSVSTDNVYQDLYNLREHLDLSEYSSWSPYFDDSNVKVPGKFKDETPGQVISEIVALKPKLYSYKSYGYFNPMGGMVKDAWWEHYEENYEDWERLWCRTDFYKFGLPAFEFLETSSQTAKGVTKSSQRDIKHDAYKECLVELSTKNVVQRIIRATKFELFSFRMSKRALSAYDDKKFLLADGINTLAYGHF